PRPALGRDARAAPARRCRRPARRSRAPGGGALRRLVAARDRRRRLGPRGPGGGHGARDRLGRRVRADARRSGGQGLGRADDRRPVDVGRERGRRRRAPRPSGPARSRPAGRARAGDGVRDRPVRAGGAGDVALGPCPGLALRARARGCPGTRRGARRRRGGPRSAAPTARPHAGNARVILTRQYHPGDNRRMDRARTYTLFVGDELVVSGDLAVLLPEIKRRFDADPGAYLLILDDATGKQVDFELRGTLEQVLERHLPPPEPLGPGRPLLGVVAREVTLLPRHWEWLADQPGGASATLRRLVDEAR